MANVLLCHSACTTCARARAWLKARRIPFEERPIREENPTAAELADWRGRSGLPLRRLFNTSGQRYRELGLSARLSDMSEQEMLDLLASDGMLVMRPFLVTDSAVLVGFREAEWAERLPEGGQ